MGSINVFLAFIKSGSTWLSLSTFCQGNTDWEESSFKIAEILYLNFLETVKESYVSNPGHIYT